MATPTPVPAATPTSTPTPAPQESEKFWNRAIVGPNGEPLPSCGDPMFTHPLVAPEEATPFLFVEDVYPHSHIVYWRTRKLYGREPPPAGVLHSDPVQLYATADIHSMQVWRIVLESDVEGTFDDWQIKADICDGYRLIFGHIGSPIQEILDEVKKATPRDWSDCPVATTEEALVITNAGYCVWDVVFDPPISAGTPISRSNGYTSGFDFGLELLGLTAEELRAHPSYGYSINPWAYSGGISACTLEYFPEPYRTAYLESMDGRCGPFNQDVPGTAMGVWLPVAPPADGSVPDRGAGTVWRSLGIGGEGLVRGSTFLKTR